MTCRQAKSGRQLYQPKAVFIDPDLLKTLPLRFLHDGLAEAIKYGCIRDAGLFAQIAAVKSDQELLEQADSIIETCCNIKARIVEKTNLTQENDAVEFWAYYRTCY